MNIFSQLQNDIKDAVLSLDIVQENETDLALDRIVVEPPRDVSHGDLACNAALVLAKPLKISPRDLAGMLVEKLRDNADIADITIAGPGFINLTFQKGFWQRQLLAIFKAGREFGRSEVGKGRRVNVEFVSANPTGPLHVGHGRGAVVGDVLANILSFAGFETVKEYYINDAGAQIDTLARSVMLRYREALGQPITEIPAGLYPGDYLVPVGVSLAAEHGEKLLEMPESEALRIARDRAVSAMMDLIRSDLAAINVHHDVFFSEQSLHAQNGAPLNKAIDDLTMKGYVYRGTLPRPKGHSGSNDAEDEWEDREQTLFKSTRAGDDIDRALFKSDGSFTYFAADLGYFFDKFKRGFDETIFVLGADHGGYVKRMEALAQAVSGGDVELSVLLCQLVRLFRNGEPIKMSKRSGDFVTLSEVVDEVGPDAVRFMMIYRKSDAPLDFDFAKVTEQSRDNPVFYVQYAHARCHSIFRQAREALPGFDHASLSLDENGVAVLEDEGEILLIRKLSEYPRVIEGAAIAHEPHRLAFYLYELASVFHGHWNRGKENPRLRFVNPAERELSEARLGIVKAVASTIASGLDIIGAAAPEEMR